MTARLGFQARDGGPGDNGGLDEWSKVRSSRTKTGYVAYLIWAPESYLRDHTEAILERRTSASQLQFVRGGRERSTIEFRGVVLDHVDHRYLGRRDLRKLRTLVSLFSIRLTDYRVAVSVVSVLGAAGAFGGTARLPRLEVYLSTILPYSIICNICLWS